MYIVANCLLVVNRTTGEVCSGVVNKCLNQRVRTKDLGMAILMMYIEIEKQDIVQVLNLSDKLKIYCDNSSSLLTGSIWGLNNKLCY